MKADKNRETPDRSGKDRVPAEFGTGRARRSEKRKLLFVLIIAAAAALASVAAGFFGGGKLWGKLYSAAGLSDSLPEPMENAASVYFFDVGQGDSSLIMADGKNVLIDGGEYDAAGKVISALRTLGVERLDHVIVTHPHSDHIGGIAEILSAVPADMMIMPDIDSASGLYARALKEAEKRKTEIMRVSEDTVTELGENSRLRIFRSLRDDENLNNNSLVVKFEYGETSFLFCGDIEDEAEQYLLSCEADIDSDVIKVPHHGSSTSDNREFIARVSPEYAVISVGESNDYGHPHKSTLRVYEAIGAKILRTDMDGNIAVFSDGESLTDAA